ncbi:hypothetical protein LguiB_012158 [Lonicera macranthoides]
MELGHSSPNLLLKYKQINKFHVVFPSQKRRLQLVKAVSDNLVKSLPEKAVRFKVRAVVTVKNKQKEDLKDTIAKAI